MVSFVGMMAGFPYNGGMLGNTKPKHYLEKVSPQGQGRPLDTGILFLHGLESHSDWWQPLIAELKEQMGLPLFRYDRTGWGRSPGQRGHISSLEECSAELFDLTGEFCPQVTRWHLVGMSWGGLFALHLTKRYPDKWHSTVLLSPGIFPKARSWRDTWPLVKACYWGGVKAAPVGFSAAEFCRSAGGQKYVQEDPWRGQQVSGQFCRLTLKLRLSLQFQTQPTPVPTLCLLPEEDQIIDLPKTRQLMWHHDIPVTTLPNSGHALVLDQPKVVSENLCRFWRDL